MITSHRTHRTQHIINVFGGCRAEDPQNHVIIHGSEAFHLPHFSLLKDMIWGYFLAKYHVFHKAVVLNLQNRWIRLLVDVNSF